MTHRPLAILTTAAFFAVVAGAACTDQTVDTTPLTHQAGNGADADTSDATAGDDDASAMPDATPSEDDAQTGDDDTSADAGDGSTTKFDAGGATTTIAAARAGNVTTPITVNAIVTALHGTIPNDVSEWYIEDLAGGANSGVVVYCDPDKTACPTIRAPARWTIVQITGSLSTYQNQVQMVPTAQTVLAMNGTPPPIPMVSATDIEATGTSTYRGVLVKLATGTKLTVDNVTPTPLLDTSCTTRLPSDAGADAGTLSCAHQCSPPAYSGFSANDGHGHEVNIEAQFFATDPLQSSPECLTQAGVVPVRKGMTFSTMEGVLDFDGYAMQQELSPVVPTDYSTP